MIMGDKGLELEFVVKLLNMGNLTRYTTMKGCIPGKGSK